MTPEQRASHAEMLLSNPLVEELLGEQEGNATDACIYAGDEETRYRAAMKVQVIRTFRSDLRSIAEGIQKRKAAPA